jgi:hypothetical protein
VSIYDSLIVPGDSLDESLVCLEAGALDGIDPDTLRLVAGPIARIYTGDTSLPDAVAAGDIDTYDVVVVSDVEVLPLPDDPIDALPSEGGLQLLWPDTSEAHEGVAVMGFPASTAEVRGVVYTITDLVTTAGSRGLDAAASYRGVLAGLVDWQLGKGAVVLLRTGGLVLAPLDGDVSRTAGVLVTLDWTAGVQLHVLLDTATQEVRLYVAALSSDSDPALAATLPLADCDLSSYFRLRHRIAESAQGVDAFVGLQGVAATDEVTVAAMSYIQDGTYLVRYGRQTPALLYGPTPLVARIPGADRQPLRRLTVDGDVSETAAGHILFRYVSGETPPTADIQAGGLLDRSWGLSLRCLASSLYGVGGVDTGFGVDIYDGAFRMSLRLLELDGVTYVGILLGTGATAGASALEDYLSLPVSWSGDAVRIEVLADIDDDSDLADCRGGRRCGADRRHRLLVPACVRSRAAAAARLRRYVQLDRYGLPLVCAAGGRPCVQQLLGSATERR